ARAIGSLASSSPGVAINSRWTCRKTAADAGARPSRFPRGAETVHGPGDSHSLTDQLTRISPFVVIPAHDLDQISIDDLRHAEIHYGGAWILDDVGRHDRIRGDAEDSAVPFALGFLHKQPVHLVNCGRSGCQTDDIGKRPDRNWSANRDAIEPAAILRQRSRGPGRRTRGCGYEVRATRSTSSGSAVCGVHDGLAGGVRMDGGHDRLLHANSPAENLHHGRNAVRGAARARDDGGIPLRCIHTVDDRFYPIAFRWRRQDDVPGAGTDMSIEVLSPGKRAGTLEHDAYVQRSPRQPRRILLTQQPQLVVTNLQMAVVCGFDRLLIPTADRVVFQEVLDTVGRRDVVRSDQ